MNACTIIARNYLARARVLAQSFLAHHPGGQFYLLCVDDIPSGASLDSRIHVVHLGDVKCSYARELCFKYEVIELCTALKPTLCRYLFDRFSLESVTYLDPDVLVLREMREAAEALEDSSLLLTPHLVKPYPLDGQRPTELDLLACGVYNLGFLGLRRCSESIAFLEWWEERLRDGCLMDPGGRHFVDQKWVDYAPSLFPSTAILRDETYNVAMWNLHSRPIARSGSSFVINGRSVAFFHFSGFGAGNWHPSLQSAPRVSIDPVSPLGALLSEYGRLLRENGDAECQRWEYGFGRFNDGRQIDRVMRRLYLALDRDQRAQFPDPFVVDRPASFRSWALAPRPESGNLSPFLISLYRLRPDVMAAFPDVEGEHRDAFVTWARTSGAREMGFDSDVIQPAPNVPVSAPLRSATAVRSVVQWPWPPQHLLGHWFDLPRPKQVLDSGDLAVSGWVLGRERAAAAVQAVVAGDIVARAPVKFARPEVAVTYPDVLHAARCGFRLTVPVELEECEVVIEAVLPGERRIPIGVIHMGPPMAQAAEAST